MSFEGFDLERIEHQYFFNPNANACKITKSGTGYVFEYPDGYGAFTPRWRDTIGTRHFEPTFVFKKGDVVLRLISWQGLADFIAAHQRNPDFAMDFYQKKSQNLPAPYTPPQPPAEVAPAYRPCDPLTPEQVRRVAKEAFAANDAYEAYARANLAHDIKNGCYAIAVEGVRPSDLDSIAMQIGDKLETDFTVMAKDGKFLIVINEIPNPASEEAAAREAAEAEMKAQRENCRRCL